jgi:hypothetical protein
VLLAVTTRQVLVASQPFCTDDTPPWFPDEAGASQLLGAPLPTQPTQPTEWTPPARQRRPLDQVTYPTAQIRHRGAQGVKRGCRAG